MEFGHHSINCITYFKEDSMIAFFCAVLNGADPIGSDFLHDSNFHGPWRSI